MAERNALTGQIIGAAIEVHRTLGPGLLESVYRRCLAHELRARGIAFEEEVGLPLGYKGIRLDSGYRLDLLVERRVVVELKCVKSIEQLHMAQLLTYLKLSGGEAALLINFNTLLLKDGIRRLVSTR